MADGIFRATEVPEDILLAIETVTGIFDAALASGKHQPGDWRKLGLVGNRKHFADHWDCYLSEVEGDDEDHLANLCCRALLLLQLRQEARHALPNNPL